MLKIYASLWEDSQQGWVWLQAPKLPLRCIVIISNPANKRAVYCEALQIDDNFLKRYNQPQRIFIETPENALVINEWYRARLGGIQTQTKVNLIIRPVSCQLYGKFKACTHHPQVIVRISVWLGFISVILGLIGIFISIASFYTSK